MEKKKSINHAEKAMFKKKKIYIIFRIKATLCSAFCVQFGAHHSFRGQRRCRKYKSKVRNSCQTNKGADYNNKTHHIITMSCVCNFYLEVNV